DGYDPETARQLGERRAAAGEGVAEIGIGEFAAGGRSHREREAWALLAAAGIPIEPTPAPRLTGPRTATPLTLTNELQRLAGEEPAAFDRCGAELAYLA